MWRYWVGGGAALVLALAGMFLFRGSAATEAKVPPAPHAAAAPAGSAEAALPEEVPAADARTREQKRFDRIDRNKDGIVGNDEYFKLRHTLFAKMDKDHDGKLSFEEWAYRGIARFEGADADKSNTLTRAEFATTAVKRRAASSRGNCSCGKPAPAPVAATAEEDGDGEE
ncbi:EF-hand domain-containing protein [Sphingomonas sp.]|uniref:EF-hand domain-containing protein n=1 Tax=Sphingomonas sp. TaxID=28214 RepID=UPI001B2728EB|nr:EF-hand domain-containing protein [Sphingomonas sp.]MBO9712031.1 EF-hand domain-containing protein [Sphingomonas sp.]